MFKNLFFICMILAFCLAPLTGCDQPSSTPASATPQQPVHLDLDGPICQVQVDSDDNAAGDQDFMMHVVCNGKELFHIDIDGSNPTAGGADGVNVDVFGRNFLNWGTRR